MHLLFLGLVALLLFGNRLPEVGRSLGRGIMEFKKGLKDVADELDRDDGEVRPRNRLKPPRTSDSYDEDEDEVEPVPARRRARPRAAEPSEPHPTDEHEDADPARGG